ncbi:MAG: diphthine--ammonia ligase [Nanoarchaeota archaeon]|nr:diphthine--ammonia ligase [Nanoarchaeota archaeon]
MRVAALFSGGKDSTLAAYLAKQMGHELVCLISIKSQNPESYMFHTPSIMSVVKQAEVMDLPLILKITRGEKEKELKELEEAIKEAVEKFNIEGVVTGAIASEYQASRIKKICDNLGLKTINPLWQKDQFEILELLIKNNFKVIVTAVAAYPLDEKWLGRQIDEKFIEDVKILHKKYKINPAGEGGEFETLVLYCPLFKRELKIVSKKISGEGNSFRMEVVLE